MSAPEGIHGEEIGNEKFIENESAEVWNNAATKHTGIDCFSPYIINKAKLEGM